MIAGCSHKAYRRTSRDTSCSCRLLQVLYTDDLCAGEQVFFAATGVSDGDLLRGVRYFAGGASSNSIVMRSGSGTGRVTSLCHALGKAGYMLTCCYILATVSSLLITTRNMDPEYGMQQAAAKQAMLLL